MKDKILSELNKKCALINSAKKAGIAQTIIDGLVNDLVVCIQFSETVTGCEYDLIVDGENMVTKYRG